MKRYLVFRLTILAIVFVALTAQARFRHVPLDEMVSQNPVVVAGKIERIKRATPSKEETGRPERLYDIAYIKVAKVLKNELEDSPIQPGAEIPLSMPSLHGPRRSTDISYDEGTEGIWILRYSHDVFWAGHPMALQPLSKEQEVIALLGTLQSGAQVVVTSNSKFALDLYAKLKDDPKVKEAGGNLFFSPYSISTALAMTWAGARGQTEKQMADVLHFELTQEHLHKAFGTLEKQLNAGGKKRGYQLSVANALWGQKGYGFLKDFIKLTEKNYGAGFREVDFVNAVQREKARKKINIWVEKKTKKKIKELIQPGILNELTTLVLTNAIYFKGDWALEFDKKKTKDAPFTISADKQVNVPMMHREDRFKYAETPDLQILELPYKKKDLSMIVFLPTKIDDLAELEKSLTLKNINEWLGKLRKRSVIVLLPRFKMTTGPLELKDILKSMGMKDAFSLPPIADFSGMTGKKDLFISNVLHKAFVAVDEKGTEAAAATAVGMTTTAIPKPPVIFRADHPFVFFIKDNRSGSILFMGRLTNPGKAAVSKTAEPSLPQDKTGNFILYVSNQSFAINPVDIKVYIDDQVAVEQEFGVGNQHNWQAFQYSLPNGTHQLRVQSQKGQAKLQKEFEVKGKHWAVLGYWFYPDTHYEPTPKKFTFGVSDKPVYFE